MSAIKKTLDDMQNYYTPGQNFSDIYFAELVQCLAKDDEINLKSQNEGWRKIYEHAAGRA